MPPEQDIVAGFPVAESWSLWVGQAGKVSIFAGIAFFVLSLLACFLQGRNPKLAKLSTAGFWLGAFSIFAAMGTLLTLFIKNQFQYEYVFGHADIHTELKYKIAGVWSGQQGSFLLWATCAALFGLLTLRGTGTYQRWYTLVYSTFLASICAILAYETPYNLIPDAIRNGVVHVPPSGNGLVPSLQNYWVVIHPPTIFLGFGSLTIFFAYSIAAILNGDLKNWGVQSRPWAMLSLALLGTGLLMGGLWAYETLGWGGFWKWDPVENTSFVPWILLVGFIHGILVQTTKQRWHGFNLWFGALPFLSFVYGTFLTRSGYLTDVSVHSFAEMQKSALVILEIFLGLCIAAFVGLYFWRGRSLAASISAPKVKSSGVEREGTYGVGMMLMALFGFVIAVGMSWPLIMLATGNKAAVIEEPVYHKVVVWFFVPIMLVMAAAPFVSWRAMSSRALGSRLLNVFSVSAGLTGFALLGMKMTMRIPADDKIAMPFNTATPALPWIAFLLFLCVFVAVSSLWRIFELGKRAKLSLGGFVAHLGLATILAGLIVSRGLESHEKTFMRADEAVTLLGYSISQQGFSGDLMDRSNKALFNLKSTDEEIKADPGLYYYKDGQGEDHAMTWPHIQRYPTHDLYLALHEPIYSVWKEPVWFKEGESQKIDDITVEYKGMSRTGQAGQAGTAFGANVVLSTMGKTYTGKPEMVIGGNPNLAQIGPDFKIALVQMNAADKSVALQLFFSSPIYPIELFYKPLVILIWIGGAIMLIGALMTGYSRRRRKGLPVAEPETLLDEPAPAEMAMAAATATTLNAKGSKA